MRLENETEPDIIRWSECTPSPAVWWRQRWISSSEDIKKYSSEVLKLISEIVFKENSPPRKQASPVESLVGESSPITELKIPVKLGLCKACKQLYSEGEERREEEEKEKVLKVDLSGRRGVSSAPPTPLTSRARLDIADPLRVKSVSKTEPPLQSSYVPSFALHNAVRRMAGTKESYLRELGRLTD